MRAAGGLFGASSSDSSLTVPAVLSASVVSTVVSAAASSSVSTGASTSATLDSTSSICPLVHRERTGTVRGSLCLPSAVPTDERCFCTSLT